ncbi:response regulator [Cytophaga hutchinsonii]|jgi:CheY-like chemotaxis protein|uniref:Two-component response regulator, CheY-like protein n=1 Tax=Cytophaga hutchinsonii (strain ATCC 33406 / DSM 1761 / CIP 103989 / NBRC 15051 / NCIMB 9469 / D465) TaxID=269798 RepID=A0A6N4SVK2_CYTH3|nr:response regulator [Cytophaga hutchinsonii]ABG60456.1 two-component response regulator, CheY-like protein [Cytophaga hutchinsonii ATCC 33406]SFX85574.1 Response regulator receiver domain-containing protein [Cytophaga hutchinsonii ATCC 33406]
MADKATIYIIDDDEIFQFITRKSFERLERNDNLFFFLNGEDALSSIKEAISGNKPSPDLIFLDINMPIMDGWDFLAELIKLEGEMKKTPQIYMVSSSIDDKDLIKSKTYNMIKDYIVKPIKDTHIKELLNNLN